MSRGGWGPQKVAPVEITTLSKYQIPSPASTCKPLTCHIRHADSDTCFFYSSKHFISCHALSSNQIRLPLVTDTNQLQSYGQSRWQFAFNPDSSHQCFWHHCACPHLGHFFQRILGRTPLCMHTPRGTDISTTTRAPILHRQTLDNITLEAETRIQVALTPSTLTPLYAL